MPERRQHKDEFLHQWFRWVCCSSQILIKCVCVWIKYQQWLLSHSVVITGTVMAMSSAPQGRLLVTVSVINTYKAGGLTVTQAGDGTTVKLVLACRTCPQLRRGNVHQPDTPTKFTVTATNEEKIILKTTCGNNKTLPRYDEHLTINAANVSNVLDKQ